MNPRGTDEKPDEPEPARPSECLEAESTDPDIETQVQELLAIGRRQDRFRLLQIPFQ